MSQSRKDAEAEKAIESAIRSVPGLPAIARVLVRPGESHNGEPDLSITLLLELAQGRMTGTQLLDAIAAATTALREIDDERSPFVTFLEPDNEEDSAEDTRPAA